jgi:hypothetical protein
MFIDELLRSNGFMSLSGSNIRECLMIGIKLCKNRNSISIQGPQITFRLVITSRTNQQWITAVVFVIIRRGFTRKRRAATENCRRTSGASGRGMCVCLSLGKISYSISAQF